MKRIFNILAAVSLLIIVLYAQGSYAQEVFFTQSTTTGLQDAKTEARLGANETNISTNTTNITANAGEIADLKTAATCAAGQALYWNNAAWACRSETDPTVQSFAKSALPACSGGQVLAVSAGNFACVDNAGGGIEIDPTVQDFAKAVLPTCLAGEMLTGDGTTITCTADQQGVTTETDPTVFAFAQNALPTCGIGQVLKSNGTAFSCVNDAGSAADALTLSGLADVTVTTPAVGQVLAHNGTGWVNATETDPGVEGFAKNATADCAAGRVLTMTGGILGCVPDAGGAADALALSDLSDVSTTTPTSGQMLSYNGSGWVNANEADPNVEAFAKAVLPTCAAGEVLKGDGTSLSCVADAGGVGDALAIGDLSDVTITAAAVGEVLAWNGTAWVDSASVGASVDLTTEVTGTLPQANGGTGVTSLPNCGAGEVLKHNGGVFSCVADAGGAGSALNLPDLGDVTITTAATGNVLTFNGTAWVNSAGVGSSVDLATEVTGQLPGANIATDAIGATQLAATTVTAGSYTNADVTVDADGRITAAASGVVDLTSEVSGTLPQSNGGTGVTSLPDCGAGEVLKHASGVFSCVADAGGSGSVLALGDLADVSATAAADNEVLTWDAATVSWQPSAIPAINAVSDISDVATSSAINGDFMQFNGTNWVNVANPNLPENSVITGFPDKIMCFNGVDTYIYPAIMYKDTVQVIYSYSLGGSNIYANYNISTGNYITSTGLAGFDCATNAYSISTLTSMGRAFKFIGTNGNQISLTEISDVSAAAPADGQVLTWNNATSKWIPAATAATVSAMNDLNDASVATAINGDFMQFNGTNWVNVANPNLPENTMMTGWPDAISCNNGNDNTLHFSVKSGTAVIYRQVYATTDIQIAFNLDGTYSYNTSAGAYDCAINTWSIADLYSQGKAHKFIGTNGNQISLTEISDVSAATPTDGQFLKWDNAQTNWVPANIPTINALSDIGDVSTTAATAGQTLVWDNVNSEWAPGSAGSASVAGSDTQIQFNDGGAMAGAAGLYWDKTNTNVGIGSATPDVEVKLDVAGAVKIGGAGTETCDAGLLGTIRYDAVNHKLQICRQ